MFEHARPGYGAFFGDMTDDEHGSAGGFGQAHQRRGAFAQLRDRAGATFGSRDRHGLYGIDDQQAWPLLNRQLDNRVEVGFAGRLYAYRLQP